MVVAGVTQKNKTEPSTHICSKGGGGSGWHCPENPPLAFLVRGVVVVGISQKNKTEPSTHICSKGGGAVAGIAQKRIRKPSTCICSKGGGWW
jgi:hypothetical protein